AHDYQSKLFCSGWRRITPRSSPFRRVETRPRGDGDSYAPRRGLASRTRGAMGQSRRGARGSGGREGSPAGWACGRGVERAGAEGLGENRFALRAGTGARDGPQRRRTAGDFAAVAGGRCEGREEAGGGEEG